MTQEEFSAHFALKVKDHPELSSDTVLHANREIFARVADMALNAPGTVQAVAEAVEIVIRDL